MPTPLVPRDRRGALHRAARFTALAAAVLVPTVARAQQPVASGAADARPTVAVFYLTNGALVGNADYAPLSKGMAEMLITELSRNPAIRVVERDRLQQLIAEQNLGSSDRVDKETAVRMGKLLGAHHLIMGGFVIDMKQNMRIDLRSVNTETSQVEHVETVTGKADAMLNLVEQLGLKMNAGLHLPQLPTQVRPASNTTPAGPNQFRAMMALSRAIEAQDRKDVAAAAANYKEALAAAPNLERAKTLLASVETADQRKTP